MARPRSRPLLAWIALLLAAALYCAWRVAAGNAFESNILGLMPDTGRELELTRLAADHFDQGFVVLLSFPDDTTALDLANDLGERLAAQGALLAENDGDPLATLRNAFAPYRHQLLSPGIRAQLRNSDPAALAAELLRELHSPVPTLRLYDLAQDPFNLGGRWLQALFAEAGRFQAGELPSLRHDGRNWWLLRGALDGSPLDPAGQGVADVVADFAAAHPQVSLLRSGLVFHAAEASHLARTEISTIGAGSLLGVLLLVLLVFRSRQAFGAIAFTLASSVLVALTVSFAVFGKIHLVTLAFGSTLLGLAVDYCFHFLVKHQALGDARAAGRLVRRGVLLGACSSIAAYLIQLWSPFPGLHQFAVFMAAGLVGAWGAVAVLWRCYQAPRSRAFDRCRTLYPRYLDKPYRNLTARRWPWLVTLAVAVPALGLWIAAQGSSDDIRLLNTSSAALLDEERQLQSLLGGIDGQRYWVVEGEGEQQVLERMEALAALLAEGGGPSPVMAASQWVPSLALQRADHALVMDRLYGPDGALAVLCARLGSDCREWRALPGDFTDGLTPAQIPPEVTELFPALRLIDNRQGLVLTRHGARMTEKRQLAAAELPGVRAVDQVAQLSASLSHLRSEATLLLALFVALFTLVCVCFGRRGLLVAGAVLVSLLVSLASSASGGVTLFHILALLLVLGLSVDTAVFYLELGLDGETWLAATLAIATSILAFGLLSLSRMPVLHHFGSVVFSGLLCSWLATPILFHLLGQPASGRKPSPPKASRQDFSQELALSRETSRSRETSLQNPLPQDRSHD